MSEPSAHAPAALALAEMAKLGGLLRPSCADQVPRGEFVYLVSNGDNVLQLGKGDDARVKRCARGGLAGKHNKAFVCAMGELVLARRNSYALLEVRTKERAADVEAQLHAHLGISTNREGATLIDGIDARSITGIHEGLWARVKCTRSYEGLDAVERLMAEELFEIATYATSRVRRSGGKIVPSNQGDNLEGNILMNLNRRHLANVFMKLTAEYLRYGPKHRLSAVEFTGAKASYSYVPRGRSFVVSNVPELAT